MRFLPGTRLQKCLIVLKTRLRTPNLFSCQYTVILSDLSWLLIVRTSDSLFSNRQDQIYSTN